VTILAVLYFLEGIAIMVGPWVIVAILAILLPGLGLVIGLICTLPFIILGLIFFLIGFGILKGADWARTVAYIFAIIGMLAFPIGTIIGIIIILYLGKREVKAYFH